LIADIVFLVFACIGFPFTAALVVRALINVAADTLALAMTAVQLATQLEDNQKTKTLIKLLEDYKKNCIVNYNGIKNCYTNIKTQLTAYKNAGSPGARVAASSTIVEKNELLIGKISENC
jgi:NifU-like protein involved in Fe-S cluster formation